MGESTQMQRLKASNRFAIIRAIQQYGPLSRAALMQHTQLSKSTVSTITAELLQQQVIGLHSVNESSGGRPATNLSFDAGAGYVIGLDLASTPVTIVLTDLQAQVHRELHCPAEALDPDGLIAAVVPLLQSLLAGPHLPLLGIGVACPGEIDRERGVVLKSGNLRMLQYPLRQILEEALDFPVSLGNDSDCAALGEKHYGGGAAYDDILYIAVGTGIGAGIISGGELFAGAHGFAGEIGHMVVTDRTDPCVCGNVGCLEAVASGPAIARTAWERLQAGEASMLQELVGTAPETCTAAAVLSAADAGDALACSVVDQAALLLGRAVAALVNALDIDTVILSGQLVASGRVLQSVEDVARALVTMVHRPHLRILPGTLGGRASAIGAATQALQGIFTPQGIDQIVRAEHVRSAG